MSRLVVLVCGPPCAGKNYYIRHHANPADVVLDYDAIAVQFGSDRAHRHTDGQVKQLAEARMLTLMTRLARTVDVTAWVIRTAPSPEARRHYTALTHATEVLVLKPPLHVALARAKHRPPGTAKAIRSWYWRYRPGPGETVIDSRGAA